MYTQQIHMMTKIIFKCVVKAQVSTPLNCAVYEADTKKLLNGAPKAASRCFLYWLLLKGHQFAFYLSRDLFFKRKA